MQHNSFADRFRRTDTVRNRYVTEGGWYIVLPESVQRGLEIVKRYQKAPAAERLAFISNPKRALRDALEDELEEDVLEHLFEETPRYLSQRIECLGEWQPKSFSYSLPGITPWFPDDARGGFLLDLGHAVIPVAYKDACDLQARMQDALNAGDTSLPYGDREIPVTTETVDRINHAVRSIDAKDTMGEASGTDDNTSALRSSGTDPEETESAKQQRELVPILADNLEEIGFSHRPHPPRGEPGGLPASLKTTSLYSHQRDGLLWLQQHWAYGSN
ncbi:hypothetical protein RM531_15980, partial [Salinisphaera sp. P385]